MGAWPGDQPNTTKGIDISRAVFSTTLLTNPMQDVQILLARRSVGAEKMSSFAVRLNISLVTDHGGLNVIESTSNASVTARMLSTEAGEMK